MARTVVCIFQSLSKWQHRLTSSNESQTSPMSATPTPMLSHPFSITRSNLGPAVPKSQFLSLDWIHYSDVISITSTTSTHKCCLWHHGSAMSTTSSEHQLSTGLTSAIVRSRFPSADTHCLLLWCICKTGRCFTVLQRGGTL